MRVWIAAMLVAVVLGGCVGSGEDEREVTPPDVGYDASDITITDVVVHDLTIEGSGGTDIATVVYEPLSPTRLPDGRAPTFPVVIFLHGWPFAKEEWQYLPMDDESGFSLPPVDLLQRFAEHGFITVAYDSRGFGRSGGEVTGAGPAEIGDLLAVMDHIEATYPTSGRVGLTGISYGAGQALLGAVQDDRVKAVVAQQGWTDLYQALFPGNVPKLEWTAYVYGTGTLLSGARLSDEFSDWLIDTETRGLGGDMDATREDMEVRSVFDAAANLEIPIMTCQGMQETLFSQSHDVWQDAGGFRRAVYHTGGHAYLYAPCFDMTLDWFRFFLLGEDTEVDAWPFLQTVDADGADIIAEFDDEPTTATTRYHLRQGLLTEYEPSNSTFVVAQRVLANPIHEPQAIWDMTGLPNNYVPEQLRQDPTAVFFESAPFRESQVVVGAPRLILNATHGDETPGPYQVVATLYHLEEESALLLGRASYAVLHDRHHDNGTIVLDFPWTKVSVTAGSGLLLKLSANDETAFNPLPANYSITFRSDSAFLVPYFVDE